MNGFRYELRHHTPHTGVAAPERRWAVPVIDVARPSANERDGEACEVSVVLSAAGFGLSQPPERFCMWPVSFRAVERPTPAGRSTMAPFRDRATPPMRLTHLTRRMESPRADRYSLVDIWYLSSVARPNRAGHVRLPPLCRPALTSEIDENASHGPAGDERCDLNSKGSGSRRRPVHTQEVMREAPARMIRRHAWLPRLPHSGQRSRRRPT